MKNPKYYDAIPFTRCPYNRVEPCSGIFTIPNPDSKVQEENYTGIHVESDHVYHKYNCLEKIVCKHREHCLEVQAMTNKKAVKKIEVLISRLKLSRDYVKYIRMEQEKELSTFYWKIMRIIVPIGTRRLISEDKEYVEERVKMEYENQKRLINELYWIGKWLNWLSPTKYAQEINFIESIEKQK